MNTPGRKLFHALSAIFLIPVFLLPDPTRKIFFIGVFLIVLAIDTLRLTNKDFRKVFLLFFRDILKDQEHRTYSGATFLFFSFMILNVFFSKEIAAFSMLLLTISDPLAAIFGRYLKPRIRIAGDKTLWGLLGFIIGGIVVSIFFHNIQWKSKLIAILVGAFIELFSRGIDDNLLIPVGCALALQLTKGGEL
ncbi:MAG: hypothetical protein GXO39_06180 [Thermotogae bacterium]|nr:hypothetical protein [Thermotogota bacterium]